MSTPMSEDQLERVKESLACIILGVVASSMCVRLPRVPRGSRPELDCFQSLRPYRPPDIHLLSRKCQRTDGSQGFGVCPTNMLYPSSSYSLRLLRTEPPRSRSFGESSALLHFSCELSYVRSFFDTAATVTITIGAWIFFVQDFGKQAPMPVVKDPPYVLVPSACVLFLKINFFNPAEPWPYASVLFRLSFSSGLTLSLR